MEPKQVESFVFKSREFSGADLGIICEVVKSYSHLGRYKLAQTIAAVLEWERANGSPKWRECLDLLAKLAGDGLLTLPELRQGRPLGMTRSSPFN